MNVTLCPAFPPGTTVDYTAKLAEAMQFAGDCWWAVQLSMPPALDYTKPDDIAKRVNTARKDWNRLIEAGVQQDPYILLNHEATAAEIPMDTQTESYLAVMAAAEAEFGPACVRGAYQVPRLTKNGTLERMAGDVRTIDRLKPDWLCPSTYMKSPGVWRDLKEVHNLADLMRVDEAPYVSAQLEGDGDLIATHHMYRLWAELEHAEIYNVIAWANMATPHAVESLRRCVEVFG